MKYLTYLLKNESMVSLVSRCYMRGENGTESFVSKVNMAFDTAMAIGLRLKINMLKFNVLK